MARQKKQFYVFGHKLSIYTLLFLVLIIGLLSGLIAHIIFKRQQPPCYRCSIVMIVIDPLRADALPCYGSIKNTMMHTCSYAHKHQLFTQAFSQSSWTLPSILSLFTSQYPTTHHMFTPITNVLSPETKTLPMALKDAGYQTVYIGQTDDTHIPLDRGVGRGFDRIIPYTSMENAVHTAKNLLSAPHTDPIFLFIHSFDLRANSVNTVRDPTTFVLDPHYIYGSVDPELQNKKLSTPDAPFAITYWRKWYDQVLWEIDQSLNDFYLFIQSKPIEKNTIFILTSAHGNEFGEHGKSGHGYNLFETSTHIPLILGIPGMDPTRHTSLVQTIDIAPTILARIGLSAPHTMTGIDVFSKDNTMLLRQLEPEKRLWGITTNHWSYYFDPTSPQTKTQGQLYDRTRDAGEQENASRTHKQDIQVLLDQLNETLSL